MRLILVFVLLLLAGPARAQTSFIKADTDIMLQISPAENAAPVFNLDKDELLIPDAPVSAAPDYISVNAQQVNGAPLTLWFKKDPSKFRALTAAQLYLEVLPKAKTNVATVASLPGKSYLDCGSRPAATKARPAPPSVCVAWPPKSTPLQILDVKLVESVDPADRLVKWRLFYQVSYSYKNAKRATVKGTGWISSDDVTTSEQAAPPPAAASKSPVSNGKTKTTPAPTAAPNPDIDRLVADLSPLMGSCFPSKGKNFKLRLADTYTNPMFTQALLPAWQKKKNSGVVPPTYKGRPLSAADLLTIDTLARTIYGEMATCNFSSGPYYLMAVAKVILNRVDQARANGAKRAQFMCNPATQERTACDKLADPTLVSDITQVIVKPFQFSTWNNNRAADLVRVLCPSGHQRELDAPNKAPSDFDKIDIDNWQDSLRVATEAVMEGEAFRAQTAAVTSAFYVSGSVDFNGYTQIFPPPKIFGQPLDKGRCMKFLRPMTKAELAAKKAASAPKGGSK